MIKERKPLALYEVKEILGKIEETSKVKEAKIHIKKFCKIDPEKAKKLREELERLDIIKLKETDISNLINILPENAVELNTIVMEAGLDADETNKVLETIKNNK